MKIPYDSVLKELRFPTVEIWFLISMNDLDSKFNLEGINPVDLDYLKQVGNYSYYKRKVRTLREGGCEFCGELDATVNRVVVELGHWRAWTNVVAPLAGQRYQFVIAPYRHLIEYHDLKSDESIGLTAIIARINTQYCLTGYATFIRSGSPLVNARSVAHLHVNLVVSDGTADVRPILGKSRETVARDNRVLNIFKRMHAMEMEGNENPLYSLTDEERALVVGRL